MAGALAAGDLDELLRWVDRLCAARDWDGLVALRDRSREAFERSGRQLWPITSQAEYRLALEAPAAFAGPVLVEGAGRFALGPLPEVAASTHTWAELAPYVQAGPAAALAAHERVVRGDVVGASEMGSPAVLELPTVLQRWEPAYPVATYRSDGADFPAPAPPHLAELAMPRPGPAVADPDVEQALRALVERWVVESNGAVAVAAVQGSAEEAVAALGHRRVRWAEVAAGHALAAMAWAGASGGAHGRRRGAALGRFGAWWALAALAGVLDDWPVPPADLERAAGEIRWARWHPDGAARGWSLHLAMEDPDENLAWAIAATDSA